MTTDREQFQLLADCIRSEQVPQQDVPRIMEENPEFAAWYAERYLKHDRR